jgi:Ankyrin repeat
VLEALLRAGADIEATDVVSMLGCIRMSLKRTSSFSIYRSVCQDEWTPLLYAVRYGREAVVQVLLAAGANTNARTTVSIRRLIATLVLVTICVLYMPSI